MVTAQALPGASPRSLNAGSAQRRHAARCAAGAPGPQAGCSPAGAQHPRKQLVASRFPRAGGLHPLRRRLPPSPALGGPGGCSRPLPTHSRAKARVADPSPIRICSCMEKRAGPFKEPLCATGKQGSLSPDSGCDKSREGCSTKGALPRQTESCCSPTVGTGGRQSGGASAAEQPVNQHVSALFLACKTQLETPAISLVRAPFPSAPYSLSR